MRSIRNYILKVIAVWIWVCRCPKEKKTDCRVYLVDRFGRPVPEGVPAVPWNRPLNPKGPQLSKLHPYNSYVSFAHNISPATNSYLLADCRKLLVSGQWWQRAACCGVGSLRIRAWDDPSCNHLTQEWRVIFKSFSNLVHHYVLFI
jgi:hypothetical protein